jgi:hypothetical protein
MYNLNKIISAPMVPRPHTDEYLLRHAVTIRLEAKYGGCTAVAAAAAAVNSYNLLRKNP